MALVLHVVGARPNFVKVAPVVRALAARGASQRLVHTGQHHGARMSDVFFEDLGLPQPEVHLGVGAGSHAEQTARIMLAFERALLELPRPDWVVVPGDVNSTLAAALVAAKLGLRVAHLEAGLRSYDRAMPEELNRVAVDHLADLLLTPSADADRNLAREGIPAARVVCVGNAMIDSLVAALPAARARRVPERLGLTPGAYGVVTLHRPSNVDEPAVLRRLLAALDEVSRALPLVFPVHPRTRVALASAGAAPAEVRVIEPLGYLDFLSLLASARLALTDSGGVQEETTALGVPCLTLRDRTERPVTVDEGTNQVVGTDPVRVAGAARRTLASPPPARCPPLWDGRAGERIARALLERT